MNIANIFISLFVIHLVADWLLQNDWMAKNKASLKSPAGWVHSGIHLLLSWIIIPFPFALIIGITHLLIDTRKPLMWWRKIYHQTTEGDIGIHVAMWGDQVIHILIIYLVSSLIYFS